MSNNTVLVSDGPAEMATTETLPLAIDFSNYLAPGDGVGAPVSALVNVTPFGMQYGTVVPLSFPALVAGNVVTQIINGSTLTARSQYRLDITATLNTDKIMTAVLFINVPF